MQIQTLVMIRLLTFVALCYPIIFTAQNAEIHDDRINEIISNVSAERIEADINKLVSFGTRHTLSDTLSETQGIGAARRWIKSEFEKISSSCDNCLDVKYHRGLVKSGESRRIPEDTWVVNVLAVKKGTRYPNRYVIMAGDIDCRVSDPLDHESENPGANDNASGMAGVLEAARVLKDHEFDNSIIFVGLSGEEQGLFGGKFLAKTAQEENWDIIGVLNNDMIGNTTGITGIKDNVSFRIFSEPSPPNADEQQQIWNRFYGGEVDGPSRQLARYILRVTTQYLPALQPKMIYRLDRFGRGGHHRPFNDAGFPGVRIMETHENYDRQHQDIRVEDGVAYGDVIEFVDFDYAAKLTTVNAISLASLGWSSPPPSGLMIGGAVQPSTRLQWDANDSASIRGYKIYWRDTTSPQWEYSKWVGKVNMYTLENIVIDNYLFGVSSVSVSGYESVVAYPRTLIPRRR